MPERRWPAVAARRVSLAVASLDATGQPTARFEAEFPETAPQSGFGLSELPHSWRRPGRLRARYAGHAEVLGRLRRVRTTPL